MNMILTVSPSPDAPAVTLTGHHVIIFRLMKQKVERIIGSLDPLYIIYKGLLYITPYANHENLISCIQAAFVLYFSFVSLLHI